MKYLFAYVIASVSVLGTDPFLFVPAIAAGVLASRHWQRLSSALALAAFVEAVTFAAQRDSYEFGTYLHLRFLTAALIIYAIYGIRCFLRTADRGRHRQQHSLSEQIAIATPASISAPAATGPQPVTAADRLSASDQQAVQVGGGSGLALRSRFRNQFTSEGIWRLYLVLTVIGLGGIAYLDIASGARWGVLPYATPIKAVPECQMVVPSRNMVLLHLAQANGLTPTPEELANPDLLQLRFPGGPYGEPFILSIMKKEICKPGTQTTSHVPANQWWDVVDTGRNGPWSFHDNGPGLNWYLIAFLVAPFLLTKSIDWVVAGNRKGRIEN